MARVDFYILSADAPDARLTCACRIAEKAVAQDKRVYILSGSDADSSRIDDLLWTFSQKSFVPHRVVGPAEREGGAEPVLIAHSTAPAAASCSVLINLTDEMPTSYEQFERVVEVIHTSGAARGRERYRRYRDDGCALEHHEL